MRKKYIMPQLEELHIKTGKILAGSGPGPEDVEDPDIG